MAKAFTLTRENAHEIALPAPQGTRHRPLNYGCVIDATENALEKHGYEIKRASYELSKPREGLIGTCMTGMLDVQARHQPADPESGYVVGILHDNMRRAGLRILAGKSVFVCDNLMTYGDDMILSHRHTQRLEGGLDRLMSEGVRAFGDRQEDMEEYIEALKNTQIYGTLPDAMLLRMHTVGGLPAQYLKGIDRNYREAPAANTDIIPDTLWGLYNACTRELRGLPLHRRMHYTRIVDNCIKAELN